MSKTASHCILIAACLIACSCGRKGAFLEGHWGERTVYDPGLYKTYVIGQEVDLPQPPLAPRMRPSSTPFTLDLKPDGTFEMQLRQKYHGDWDFTGHYAHLFNMKMDVVTTATEEDRAAAADPQIWMPLKYEKESGQLTCSDYAAAANGGEIVFTRAKS